jgi:hypothetical protein
MIKKLLRFLFLFLLTSTLGFAQNDKRDCGSMEVLQQQIDENPLIKQNLDKIEQQTNAYIERLNQKNKGFSMALSPTQVITIPVVVHVIWNSAEENISDAQVQSQIQVLSEDFRKMNSDVTKTPSLFAGLAADSYVQFVLATVDPSGNPTNGITRTKTKTTAFRTNDAMKFTSKGGHDAWPADQYLNLWVCDLGRSLLGYAQFPGGDPRTDGVVCHYKYTGTTGTSTAPYHLGRTATHEVGHWLNLRHIWGDANCGNDFVNDTPTQQTSNGGCPAFPKPTCGNTSDMWMNYMDYTYDACMYMFSEGQKVRMRALFEPGGARASFTGGTSSLSAVTTTSARENLSITLSPNPAKDETVVSFYVGKDPVNVSFAVMDVLGAKTSSKNFQGVSGTVTHTVNVSSMKKGLYFVVVQSEGFRKVEKLIIAD